MDEFFLKELVIRKKNRSIAQGNNELVIRRRIDILPEKKCVNGSVYMSSLFLQNNEPKLCGSNNNNHSSSPVVSVAGKF